MNVTSDDDFDGSDFIEDFLEVANNKSRGIRIRINALTFAIEHDPSAENRAAYLESIRELLRNSQVADLSVRQVHD